MQLNLMRIISKMAINHDKTFPGGYPVSKGLHPLEVTGCRIRWKERQKINKVLGFN